MCSFYRYDGADGWRPGWTRWTRWRYAEHGGHVQDDGNGWSARALDVIHFICTCVHLGSPPSVSLQSPIACNLVLLYYNISHVFSAQNSPSLKLLIEVCTMQHKILPGGYSPRIATTKYYSQMLKPPILFSSLMLHACSRIRMRTCVYRHQSCSTPATLLQTKSIHTSNERKVAIGVEKRMHTTQ